MTVNAYRYEMRLGDGPEASIRVAVSLDTLRKNTHQSTRRVLAEAAIEAFRERARVAGYDPASIETEVSAFHEALARI